MVYCYIAIYILTHKSVYTQCYFAQTRNRFDESNCLFNLLCLGPVATRNIIREGYGINGSCVGDIFQTWFCPCCTAIQLSAEVNQRGKVTGQNYVQYNVNVNTGV